MKYFLLLLVACSGMSEGTYKKKYHLNDFQSDKTSVASFKLLSEKMKKCYPESPYPAYEKTVANFNEEKQTGTIAHEIDNQGLGPQVLVLIEIFPVDVNASLIKVYSKGDLFRARGVYKHQIQKWLDGKVVDCNSRGKI